MRRIKDWRVRRAGGTVTIYGTWADGDGEGGMAKVTGVEEVRHEQGMVVAQQADGTKYRLVVEV